MSLIFRRLAAGVIAGLITPAAHAQMVSATGLGFVGAEIADEYGYAQAGYTFAPRWAAGPAWYRIAGDGPTLTTVSANINWLAARHNARDWQANLYLGAGAGVLHLEGRSATEMAGVGLLQADWEDRDWHILYQGQMIATDERFHLANTVHLGWAPWRANYDEIAPWLYLRLNYVTARSHHLDVGPMLVLMYRNLLVEAGVDLRGKPMFGLRYLHAF